MKENKIKKANTIPGRQAGSENMSTADVDAVMKKYDRESNIRVWTGKYSWLYAACLVAFFSVVYLCYLICNLPGGNPTDFFSGADHSYRISYLSGEKRRHQRKLHADWRYYFYDRRHRCFSVFYFFLQIRSSIRVPDLPLIRL